MRAILALALLSLPPAAVTPELELQAGWFQGTDFSLDPGSAELALRLGAAGARRAAGVARARGLERRLDRVRP
ncbi:MAG TPA: hypothetical protein VFL36_04240, partial [Myxococcales bacterium]|nr:hypothetical protein [Myxococcales bacterium]